MFRKQPKIEVKPNETDLKIMKFGWILVGLHFCLTLIFYFDLPEKIPTHFNLQGEIDGYGRKSTIWVLFVISLACCYGIHLLATKLKPHLMNYPVKVTEKNAKIVYGMNIRMLVLLSTLIALVFLLITVHTILIASFEVQINFIFVVLFLSALSVILPFYFIFKMFKIPK